MQKQDSTSNDLIDFPDQRKFLNTIGQAAESQPTKSKVAAFKTRVFKLIKIYSEKAHDLTPLLNNFTQEIFNKEPQKMNQIVSEVLNRKQDLDRANLVKLIEIYKIMLLYKGKIQQNSKICENFIKMLKKVMNQQGQGVVQQMVEKVFTKRSCKLNVTFFQYLIRKIPATKKIILQSCNSIQQSKKLRPAQIKQIQKIKGKIKKNKQKSVKKQQVIEE